MATKQQTYQDRIISDPRILAGKPVVKGTRIPVKLVLQRLAQDLDTKTLFQAYPRLTEEDVKATLTYAESLLEQEEQVPHLPQKKASLEEVLSLAGAWGERDWNEVEHELDRIRHESTPTPPLELDL
jgi:uncharacterized protein (DUF433 family)